MIKEQKRTLQRTLDRTETGQTTPDRQPIRYAKTHQEYWKKRLRKRSYRQRGGAVSEVPEWQVRMYYRGKEAWFNLGEGNQIKAAIKAKKIYLSIISKGWDVMRAEFKPDVEKKNQYPTVGEFIEEVRKKSGIRPATL